MKKKLFLSIVFIMLVSYSSMAQINSDFLKKEKNISLIDYSKELPDYKSLDYDIRLNNPSLVPSKGFLSTDNSFGPNSDGWIGQEMQITFSFYNIPIQTNYQFDIQGRFQCSSMSISLSKD